MTRIAALTGLLWVGMLVAGCSDTGTTIDSPEQPPSTVDQRSDADFTLSPALMPGAVAAPATILVVGDSISAAYGIQREQGWVALLGQALQRLGSEHRVINASISGDTTGGGLARLPNALATHQPDLVVLELGGNDGLRGYPVKRLRANLAAMIEASVAADASVLLVGMQIPPNYGPRYTAAFANTFNDLADEYDVPWVPSFLEDVALAGNLMQSDGIHPTADAQPLLLQAIWPQIAEFLEAHQ